MENHLYTCCGSPAYAAPELISGKEYLGAEVQRFCFNLGELCLQTDKKKLLQDM